jgi:hypothetical protein
MLERDSQRERKIKEDDFKSLIFANNPDLYQSIYGEDSDVIDEEGVEHVIPDSDQDFNKLMRELQQLGVIE